MPKPAKPNASAASVPASQREESAAPTPPGDIIRDDSLNASLREIFAAAPEQPADPAAADPAEDAAPDATPATDAEAAADEAHDQADDAADPAEDDAPAETDEERTARLEQQEGESDEDYAARLAAEDGADDAEAGKVGKGLQKRFRQLTEEKKTLAAKLAAAEARAAAAEAATQAPAARTSTLTATIQAAATPEKLAELRARLEAWEDFALAHPQGTRLEPEGGEPVDYSAERIAEILVDTRRALREIPAQERWIEQARTAEAEALKAYPAYGDASSPLSKSYAEIVRRAPALARLPEVKLLIADAVRGRALRQKSAPAELPGRPVPRTATPPAAGRPPVRSVNPTDAQTRRQIEARRRLEKTGGEEALTSFFATG